LSDQLLSSRTTLVKGQNDSSEYRRGIGRIFCDFHSLDPNPLDVKVILETDRLLLREYAEEDAEAFFKLNTDPEVVRFVPDKPLLNVEQARQTLIDHPIADYRRYGFGREACILKSTGEQIGLAGLKYMDELGEVDVAYRLLPAHWGRGLATEAALASVRYGFADLGLKRIIGLVMPENTASVRVLEKTGLSYAETVTFWGHRFSKYIITP
jgi:ribosomal-protein-alanine N-acetyltransferase